MIQPSGGVISSEAGSVFGSHGMGKESVMRNLAALNQLWGWCNPAGGAQNIGELHRPGGTPDHGSPAFRCEPRRLTDPAAGVQGQFTV